MKTIICPHCGGEYGFYLKEQVTGPAITHYTKEGHYAADNGQIYDSLRHYGGKISYCRGCDKRIGKSADLISGLLEADQKE